MALSGLSGLRTRCSPSRDRSVPPACDTLSYCFAITRRVATGDTSGHQEAWRPAGRECPVLDPERGGADSVVYDIFRLSRRQGIIWESGSYRARGRPYHHSAESPPVLPPTQLHHATARSSWKDTRTHRRQHVRCPRAHARNQRARNRGTGRKEVVVSAEEEADINMSARDAQRDVSRRTERAQDASLFTTTPPLLADQG